MKIIGGRIWAIMKGLELELIERAKNIFPSILLQILTGTKSVFKFSKSITINLICISLMDVIKQKENVAY